MYDSAWTLSPGCRDYRDSERIPGFFASARCRFTEHRHSGGAFRQDQNSKSDDIYRCGVGITEYRECILFGHSRAVNQSMFDVAYRSYRRLERYGIYHKKLSAY